MRLFHEPASDLYDDSRDCDPGRLLVGARDRLSGLSDTVGRDCQLDTADNEIGPSYH